MHKKNPGQPQKGEVTAPKDLAGVTSPQISLRWEEKLSRISAAITSNELRLNSTRAIYNWVSSPFGDFSQSADTTSYYGTLGGVAIKIETSWESSGGKVMGKLNERVKVSFGTESVLIAPDSDKCLRDLADTICRDCSERSPTEKKAMKNLPAATSKQLKDLKERLQSGYDFGWTRHEKIFHFTGPGPSNGGWFDRQSETEKGSNLVFEGSIGDSAVMVEKSETTTICDSKSTHDLRYKITFQAPGGKEMRRGSSKFAQAVFEKMTAR